MRCLGILVATALAAMVTGSAAQTIAPGPLETAKTLVKAISTSDIDLLLGTFADEATVFMPFIAAPTRLSGKVEIRQAFESLFKGIPAGAAPQVITPLEITTQSFGDVAIVTFHLGQVPRQPAAGPIALGRRTLILHRVGERWFIVHLHASNLSSG